ncbi:DNA methylase [Candidatus Roizmanbacteria bacterium CG_4_9_14_0_2_um_filter_39_13]|uniref:site-specific DNA-methyltransferase (cytosine-N(4)-specific) n=1 Tax=Candidatus Roizmanbacteria bacterium CG_4_9_14_0_2_um_filter_39_13 TaxID=1974839 RepID=A0A2M8EWM7_9BACT|nr:MAG: DNA methylase [Candidatus Roizmanbacteria bacterium CG_4_10_14_0_2_um_filter_39_12]PJC30267.1 MAG: DNA methylase [Candidatus Roizmanbacteria bacterium CG_4_9_14_0_2_um_filter_39_13]
MYDNTVAQKISKQYNQTPLVNFASVNLNTKLDDLNLNWRERDLPEMERTKHVHRLHPYMGKFIPQLVEIFLRKYQPKLVYDPFCGSGTTLVEANVLGIDSIGTDISIFNTLLSKVKTAEYDVQLLEKEIKDVLQRLYIYKSKFSKDEKVNKLFTIKNEYINNWFAPNTQKELLCYLRLINDYTYQDLLKIVLSRSARSARLVTHYDLDFPKVPQTKPYQCYKHGRVCTPVDEAYKFLSRYTIDTLERVKEFSKIKTKAKVTVNHADSRTVELPRGIDMVFTSPPYIGLIDYHEQHKYAYELLGLQNNETREIGPAKNGQSERAKKEYIDGINAVLSHTRNFMTKDGLALIVVNDKYNLYKPEAVGFKSIGRVDRHVNRRTGRRDTPFYESILIWQKI